MKIYLLLLIAVLCFTEKEKGFLSRYWDCCKPSCSWPKNTEGHLARHCDAGMNTLSDPDAESICDNGISTTCLDQIPIVVNDNLAYAFAAVPEKDPCGKCYELTFNGKGKYEDALNHKKLVGKKLIVIGTNIGYQVSGGQFEILIPGGGVGLVSNCDKILGNNLGKRYGGFLSDCEEEVGYNLDGDTKYEKRKSCLTSKCNASFTGISQALEGCLFLANWLEAAGNPSLEYEEVECPQELLSKY